MRIFISYSHKEEDFALRMRDALRSAGHQTWRDHDNISPGSDWRIAVDEALKQCDVILAILSPDALVSTEVRNEVDVGLNRGVLLPVLYQPIDSLPYHWSRIQYIDFCNGEAQAFEQLFAHLEQVQKNQPGAGAVPNAASQQKDRHVEANLRLRLASMRKMRERWIDGVLVHSLKLGKIELKLDSLKNVQVFTRAGEAHMGVDIDIPVLLEQLQSELLILGEPGSGKTTLILQILAALLEKAQANLDQPVPLFFNLSSWANDEVLVEKLPELNLKPHNREVILQAIRALVSGKTQRKTFSVWLLDTMHRELKIPQNVAADWLDSGDVLLLLDGLDEVSLDKREECLETLRAFRATYPQVRMIVGSRTAEYNALRAYWGMDNALVLAPIDDDVLDRYLAPPDNFAALRRQLATSAASRKLAETPYWIAMMAYVYQDAAEIHFPTNQMEQIEAIHTAYIDKQLAQRSKQNAHYGRAEIDKYLRWLAWKMKEHGVTLFAPDMINLRWAGGGIQGLDEWMSLIFMMSGGLAAGGGVVTMAAGALAGSGGWHILSRLASHYVLRLNGTLPHNLPAFLDEMVALGLLRKVDKHYLFLHDNLRHYHFYWPMLLETEKQKKKKST